jgi:hypothetical protein
MNLPVTPSLVPLAGLALLAGVLAWPQNPAPGPLSAEQERVVVELGRQGVTLDPVRGLCSIEAQVEVQDDLLEYLLVGPAGAIHESAFGTGVLPGVLNVALLTLGAEPGTNASWSPKDPRPSDEDLRAGVSPYDIQPPLGDGFYLYLGWRDGEEVFFYRVEDLLRNLATGRAMERHRWVYLGSRMVPDTTGDDEIFAADVYHNLVNVSYFAEGYTLITGSLPECLEQTIWMVNGWIVPPRGSKVRFFFSRERIDRLPEELAAQLPDIAGSAGVLETEEH